MLAIKAAKHADGKCTPNIIPCRIHHDGPTKVTKRYWAPTTENDGTQTAYFRGRKLRGRVVKLPAKYQGLILRTTDHILPEAKPHVSIPRYDDDDDDEDEMDLNMRDEPAALTKIAEQISSFDEFVVWGHDQVPALDDAFVRNVSEWIDFAEAIHGNSQSATTPNATEDRIMTTKK